MPPLLPLLLASVALAIGTPFLTSAGTESPEPPRQHRSWQPPRTDLPASLISSAKILFALGLPDPRGCEYCEFTTFVNDRPPLPTSPVSVHGWILPARPNQEQFAIGWNGLVYPVLQRGPKASLKRDVAALLQAEALARQKAGTNYLLLWPLWNNDPSESYSISETNPALIKVLFLLRLGQARLAQEYWAAWHAVKTPYEQPEDYADPFRGLAYAWSCTLFDRTMRAHLRGDDQLAVMTCQQLIRLRPEIERETARRGFSHPLGIDAHGQIQSMPYFDFLKPVTPLLADAERRLKAPPRESVLRMRPDKFPDQTKRISVLISDLDEIGFASMMDQFGVGLYDDPTVVALIAEGDAAVEPLIKCMMNDQRLTRAVECSQAITQVTRLVPVSAAAQTALDRILMVHLETAADYQAYWDKYESCPLPERWYRTLQDDQAGRKQWLQAAENILSRTDGRAVYLWRNAPAPDATNGYTYYAARLRSKTNPSVSDLLIKRILEIAPSEYNSSAACWAYDDATELGLMLAEWAPGSAASVLQKIIPLCPVFYNWNESDVQDDLATVAVALAQLGDPSGLDTYSKWLGNQSFAQIDDARPKVLWPLGHFPNDPAIKEVSAKLFKTEKAGWLSEYRGNDPLKTRLILNEPFRLLVLRGLTNTSPAGTFLLQTNGQFTIETAYGGVGGMFEPDPLAPKPGEKVSVRVCDDLASRLNRVMNLPEFKIYWPQARRDAVLADIIKFLTANGDQLKLQPGWWPEDED